MERSADSISTGFGGFIGIDTTFVLYFLALEYGRSVQLFSMDAMLLGITMLMLMILPYFLPAGDEAAGFVNWIVGRLSIAVLGIVTGLVFKQSLGVILPDSMRFLPLTLLIVASIASCYIQFYGLMKLRLAK